MRSAIGVKAPYLAFCLAVLFAATVGGRKAGWLATSLATISAGCLLDPARISLPNQLADFVSLVLFISVSMVMVGLTDRWHLAQDEAKDAGRSNRETLENITDAFLTLDSMDRVTFVNTKVELIVNRDAVDILGRELWQIFPDIEPSVIERFHASLRDQTPAELETFYRPWGRWFVYKIYPRGKGDLAVYFRDISVEKRATEALRDNEKRLRELLDLIPAVVWTADANGSLDYMSKSFTDLTGLSGEEVRGEGWKQAIHSEDRATFAAAWSAGLQSAAPFRYEHRLQAKSGRYRWFLGRAVPLPGTGGKGVRWFGSAIDISDVRRAREEASLLADAGLLLSQSAASEKALDNVAHLLVPYLADWCAIDVEDEAGVLRQVSFVHCDSQKDELGREIERCWPPPKDLPYGRNHVFKTGLTEFTFRVTDDMLAAASQSEEHLEALRGLGLCSHICVPLKAQDKVWGALTLCYGESGREYKERDVALAEDLGRRAGVGVENARLHESAEFLLTAERAARQEAERAGNLKDEFLATLSHELRTPLNAILGWSQLLRKGNGDPEDTAQGLETIERNARAQAQIIEDLLDMSRIVSGKLVLDCQPTDLSILVRGAMQTVHPSADSKGVLLRGSFENPPFPVSIDPARMQQVVWNLLTNAIKFTPRGGKIDVKLERLGKHVALRVADSGKGITADFLPYIFERFRQQDGSITRSHGGLGLGLSIASQLVEMHGGTIRAQSEGEGKGSTFLVTLPVVKFDEAEASKTRVALESIDLKGLRIIAIDDDDDARELIRRVLSEAGAEVATAASAEAALGLLEGQIPDLLISDIGMPGKDGYQLIREVRLLSEDRGGKVPAIAVTAFARSEDRTRALVAGFNLHISKPIDPSEVIASAASLTGRT